MRASRCGCRARDISLARPDASPPIARATCAGQRTLGAETGRRSARLERPGGRTASARQRRRSAQSQAPRPGAERPDGCTSARRDPRRTLDQGLGARRRRQPTQVRIGPRSGSARRPARTPRGLAASATLPRPRARPRRPRSASVSTTVVELGVGRDAALGHSPADTASPPSAACHSSSPVSGFCDPLALGVLDVLVVGRKPPPRRPAGSRS